VTRYALRRDSNEAAIVAALRTQARVWIIGKPVDLLVGYERADGTKSFWFVECKDGAKPQSARKKTELQCKFFEEFGGWPVSLVDSPESALRHLKALMA